MKKSVRKIAMAVLIVVFTVSTALALRQIKDNTAGEAAYENAMAVAMQSPAEQKREEMPAVVTAEEKAEPVSVWMPAPVEDDPVLEEMKEINLSALREINPDVVGWIRIPGTQVDYPLMQGEDNDFYLHNTWQKDANSVGSIFLEHLNSSDLTDFNTIIYGHNMKNGSMFGELDQYAVQKFWEANPYVYIASDDGVYRYEIFAFFQPLVDSLTYGMNPQREDTKEKFLATALEESWIDTGVLVSTTDRVLTLSTCSGGRYTHRYVVQARLPMVEVYQ